MLKGFYGLVLLVALIACSDKKEQENKGEPNIAFANTEFDFGTILMGEQVAHRFIFKNTGKGDLYIKNVEPDCGCTVVNYKKDAIGPGEESFIEALYNSSGDRGLQVKKMKVYTNTKSAKTELIISATVDYSKSIEQNIK